MMWTLNFDGVNYMLYSNIFSATFSNIVTAVSISLQVLCFFSQLWQARSRPSQSSRRRQHVDTQFHGCMETIDKYTKQYHYLISQVSKT